MTWIFVGWMVSRLLSFDVVSDPAWATWTMEGGSGQPPVATMEGGSGQPPVQTMEGGSGQPPVRAMEGGSGQPPAL